MKPRDPGSTASPDDRSAPDSEIAAQPKKAAKVRLEMSQHGSLLTPAVLAVLYDIIEASRASGRDDVGDRRAS